MSVSLEQHLPQHRVLAAWLPDWPSQRARLERPELVGQPLAFVGGDGRSERVVSCSCEARRLGVTIGMRTSEAEALAGLGRLTLLASQAGADRRELERLAIGCERFGPIVAVEDSEAPSAVLIEVTGVAPLWSGADAEGERRLAEAAEGWFRARRLQASIAVAPTVGLALSLTRYAAGGGLESREPCRLAGVDSSIVDRLPIEALRTDPTIVETLFGLGVEEIGQLRELPRSSLRARFGDGLLGRLDQLLGAAPEPFVSLRDEPPLRAAWPFEMSVSNAEILEGVVRRLIERLAERTRRRRVGVTRLLVAYRLDAPQGTDTFQTIPVRLFRPTASAKELFELFAIQSAELRLRWPVAAVEASVASTSPLSPRQATLFDDYLHEDGHELALLINRLGSRVGTEQVFRVEKRSSHQPERSYELTPAIDCPPRRFELTPLQAERSRRLPLRMGDAGNVRVRTGARGEPIEVGQPIGKRVRRTWGPERVETGWWRRGGVRRDAWWVELEDGSRLWLCRHLQNGEWRLAGEFF